MCLRIFLECCVVMLHMRCAEKLEPPFWAVSQREACRSPCALFLLHISARTDLLALLKTLFHQGLWPPMLWFVVMWACVFTQAHMGAAGGAGVRQAGSMARSDGCVSRVWAVSPSGALPGPSGDICWSSLRFLYLWRRTLHLATFGI